jgi:sporulation protein YlmC with PRC-barrel domain
MGEPTEFTIGSDVACRDGACGKLTRVVVDPVARTLTHLVVEPEQRRKAARLVPVDLVESTSNEIRLRCTRSQFDELEEAEETHFLPGASGQWGYGQEQMLSWPYFGLMGGSMGVLTTRTRPRAVTYDRVPAGEVEVRRGDRVHATDGEIGRVQGLVIDPGDHQVTHVLLDEGHLWGKKRVVVPISAVTGADEGIRLNLTKDQVSDLPPVELDEPD